MSFKIAGKNAFVTGANRGIGEALVDALVAAGAAKVYVAPRHTADLEPLVPLELDVTDERQVAAAQATDVQLLVNNAGVAAHTGGAFTDPAWIEAGRKEMEVNFFGTFRLTQAFAPVLAANDGGAGLDGIAGELSAAGRLHSASKAATHSLTQSTRIMLNVPGHTGVRRLSGPIDTRMAHDTPMDKTAPAYAVHAIVSRDRRWRRRDLPGPDEPRHGRHVPQIAQEARASGDSDGRGVIVRRGNVDSNPRRPT